MNGWIDFFVWEFPSISHDHGVSFKGKCMMMRCVECVLLISSCDLEVGVFTYKKNAIFGHRQGKVGELILPQISW